MKYSRKYKFIDYIIVALLIINIASASSLCYNFIYVISSLLFLLIISLSNKLISKPIILSVIMYLLLVEFAATLYLSQSMNLFRLFNYIYPILFAYCALSISQTRLFPLFENSVYYLSVLSIPLFCIQLTNLPLIESMSSVFSKFLAEPLRYENSWYAFVFNYCSLREEGILTRNSGFMWEPGAYAMILICMIIYRLVSNGFKLKDSHILIYTVAILTTFSTAGYIALFLIISAVLLKQRSLAIKFSLAIFLIAIVTVSMQMDFISEKIMDYIVDAEEFRYADADGDRNAIEFNRYLYFLYSGQKVLEYPIGYGTYDLEYNGYTVIAPNGFANIMYHWGVIGVFFIIYAFNKFLKRFQPDMPFLCTSLFITSILVVMFSNPVDRSPLLFMIIFLPFLLPTYRNESSCRL